MDQAIIAVDSGGSKTKISIIDGNKNIVYTHQEGSGSPAVIGEKKALDNIYKGIKLVYNYGKSRYDFKAIIVGISALRSIIDPTIYTKQYEQEFNTQVRIESDALLALYSIITDVYQQGILVLSGTGSAVLGINDDDVVLTGGWGHLLTECGSAFTTVRDFLKSVIRHYEETNHITSLGEKFIKLLNYTNVSEIRKFMYQNTKTEIASYSRFITAQANDYQDQEAIALLKQAGKDLAADVRNAYRALKLSDNAVLGFRGGFITNSDITQAELITELKKYQIKIKIIEDNNDPIYGAYYMAKRWEYL